jgi:hypothetical protein
MPETTTLYDHMMRRRNGSDKRRQKSGITRQIMVQFHEKLTIRHSLKKSFQKP